MKKKLSSSESSKQKKEKISIWYNVFHWALVIYLFVATIALFYGGYIFVDYLVTSIKNWV